MAARGARQLLNGVILYGNYLIRGTIASKARLCLACAKQNELKRKKHLNKVA